MADESAAGQPLAPASELHRAPSMTARLILLAIVSIIIIVASAWLGHTRLDLSDATSARAFWMLRAPRTALAACAGAGLALSGVLFQALFRNPLAEPYTLGIASGASLGAAAGFLLGVHGYWFGLPRLSLLALAGASAAMGVVYLMARLRAGQDMGRLLLAGVCVAYMSGAGVLLITFLAGRAVTNDIVVWMMGSLAVVHRQAALEVLAVLVPTLAFAIYSHRAIDLLGMGQSLAAARGVSVSRTLWGSFVLVGLLTATIVANCGPVGFVGLMVPHMARPLVGLRTLPLAIGAVFLGAAFLALCDGVARSLSAFELPVGVATNILGAGFFFYLLARRETQRS